MHNDEEEKKLQLKFSNYVNQFYFIRKCPHGTAESRRRYSGLNIIGLFQIFRCVRYIQNQVERLLISLRP
jgi:hypothetical protein